MRRLTRPHGPPVMWCSIVQPSDPSVRPVQTRKPISHARKKFGDSPSTSASPDGRSRNPPTIPASRPIAPIIIARCWNRSSAGAFTGSACLSICVSEPQCLSAPVRAGAGGWTLVGSPPGMSERCAFWLNCSARMYAAMFHRSRGVTCAQ